MSQFKDRVWSIKVTDITGEILTLDNIDFTADIIKTIKAEPNESTINIRNLKKETRDFLTRENSIVELNAGYAASDLNGLIFKAQIDFALSSRNGVDWETILTCRDGAKTTRNAKIKKVFAKGTPYKTIANELVKVLTTAPVVKNKKGQSNDKKVTPLKKGSIKLDTITGTIPKARSLDGLAIDYYAELCRDFNLRWQILDETLHTVESNLSILNETIILDSDSGLLGVPEQTETGWKFPSLLRYDMQPGQQVLVNSEVLKSSVLMTDVIHRLDTQGDWLTEIEGFKL